MDIQKRLEKEHSKSLTLAIVKYVGDDKKRFKELFDIFINGEYRITQRAAWSLSYVAIQNPKLIFPHLGILVKRLKEKENHPSINRNILRILQEIDVPEKYQAEVFDLCIKFMMSESEPIAIRAFSITVAQSISKKYPEFQQEFYTLLQDISQLPQSPAIKQRIKLAIKQR